MCGEREWGLTFHMWSAMPGYIIVPPDSMSFQYRSLDVKVTPTAPTHPMHDAIF